MAGVHPDTQVLLALHAVLPAAHRYGAGVGRVFGRWGAEPGGEPVHQWSSIPLRDGALTPPLPGEEGGGGGETPGAGLRPGGARMPPRPLPGQPKQQPARGGSAPLHPANHRAIGAEPWGRLALIGWDGVMFGLCLPRPSYN